MAALHRQELSRLPSQQADFLRDRLLADASLTERAHEFSTSAPGGSAAVRLVRWLIETLSACQSKRRRLLAGLDLLSPSPTDYEVAESGNCFRCRADWGKRGPLCAHCKLEATHDEYFYSLYSHRRQRRVELVQQHARLSGQVRAADDAGAAAGNVGEAFLEDSPLVRLLHALIAWAMSQAAAESGRGAGEVGLWMIIMEGAARERETIRMLKREIRQCREVWKAHFDLLSQLDEIRQSMTVMSRVQTEEELREHAPLEAERHLYVGAWEHDERKAKYEADLVVARDELRACRLQYSYLRNQAALEDSETADAAFCPVCHEEIGRERTVPRCAHSLCTPCAEKIMRRHGGKFQCPLCRDESYEPAIASPTPSRLRADEDHLSHS